MTHSPDGGEPFRLSPDEAFTLLGNETRIEILQALWEACDPHVDENAVSFSDLYERVGVEDTVSTDPDDQIMHDQHSALTTNGGHHRGSRTHD